MTVKTYDPACYELAEHFLEPSDFPAAVYRARCHSLALAIQQAVEDWFEDEPRAQNAPHIGPC
jgi:hypothetical protein